MLKGPMKINSINPKDSSSQAKSKSTFFKKSNTYSPQSLNLKAKGEQKKTSVAQDLDPLSIESLSQQSPLALRDLALQKHQQFKTDGVSAEIKSQAALSLIFIFHVLQKESNKYKFAYSLGEKPQNRAAEIWKVYAGFGDPMMGDLKSIRPFTHLSEWKSALSAWDKSMMHKAYLAKGKNGEARFNNSGLSNAGAELAYVNELPVLAENRGTSKDPNPHFAELKSASEWNSNASPNPDFEMSIDEFMGALNRLYPTGVSHGKTNYKFEDHRPILEDYLFRIKQAIKIAKLDTIQSQAAYMAQGLGEMQYARLTEGQSNFFNNDPKKNTYFKDDKGPLGYTEKGHESMKKHRGSVDPLGLIEKFKHTKKSEQTQEAFRAVLDQTFIGRGPIQVTHDYNYAKTLFYLQKIAQSTRDTETQAFLWKAIYEIKKDPSAAAKPEYSFLFSAAYMHASGGVKKTSKLGDNIGAIADSQIKTDPETKKKHGAYGSQRALLDWVAGDQHNYLVDGLGSSTLGKANTKIKAYNEFFTTILDIKNKKNAGKEKES